MDKKVQWSMAGAVWVLVLGMLALGYFALSHGSGKGGAQAEYSLEPAPGRHLCPIDRFEVTMAADTPRLTYMETTYYFCSRRDEKGRDHKTLFLMDPDYYLKGQSAYPDGMPGEKGVLTPASTAAPTAVPQG